MEDVLPKLLERRQKLDMGIQCEEEERARAEAKVALARARSAEKASELAEARAELARLKTMYAANAVYDLHGA